MPRFFDSLIDDFMGLDLDDRHFGRRSRRNRQPTFYEPEAYMSGGLGPGIEISDRRRRHHRLRHDDFFGDDDYYYLDPRWHDRSISAVQPERRHRRSGFSGLFGSRRDRDPFDDFDGFDDFGLGFDHGHSRRRSSRRNRGHDMYFPDIPDIPEVPDVPRIPRVPRVPDPPRLPFHDLDTPQRSSRRSGRRRDDWYDMPGTHRTYRTRPGDQGVYLVNEHHTGPFGERSRGERSAWRHGRDGLRGFTDRRDGRDGEWNRSWFGGSSGWR
jgi:hypothetical protein